MTNVVAIGDVHGCFSTLQQTIQPLMHSQSEVVFLGDLIDRSPESNGDLKVLQLVHFMQRNPAAFGLSKVTVLTGNHEQMFLHALDTGITKFWTRNGGNERLLDDAQPFVDWLRNLPYYYIKDDFLFVHAGVKPNVPFDKQDEDDFIWIRDEFLDADHHGLPYTVVHGHTPVEMPTVLEHRINIDTGACYGGHLTALSIPFPR